MNVLILLLCAIFVGSACGKGPVLTKNVDKNGAMQANMNDYLDEVMVLVGPWLVANGFDPMFLPEFNEHFEAKPFFITYRGDLYLSNGKVMNIRQVTRAGDATMHYDKQLLRVEVGVALQSLDFNFDYKATVMDLGLGPSGWLEGYVHRIEISCDFLIDMADFYVYMQDFRIVSIGSIDIKLKGNILIDWLGNTIIKVVNVLFRERITQHISEKVKDLVQETIDNINNHDISARQTKFMSMAPALMAGKK